MPNIEIEQTIFKETQSLSANALQEVLDFIQFIKMKECRKGKKDFAADRNIDTELRALDSISLAHVEEEFAHYKELYPYELRGQIFD